MRKEFNPLEPKYKLPKFDEVEPIMPKFIRDSIRIDDIDVPNYGFVHEKYIISSDNQSPRKFENKKNSPSNKENEDSKLKQSKM